MLLAKAKLDNIMGIRFEKDTLLNWINEMGKFLRLMVDSYDAFDKTIDPLTLENGYSSFFETERSFFLGASSSEVEAFASELQEEQIRPLAQFLIYDGLLHDNQSLLLHAKSLFSYHAAQTGNFSFEDFGHLAKIDAKLPKP